MVDSGGSHCYILCDVYCCLTDVLNLCVVLPNQLSIPLDLLVPVLARGPRLYTTILKMTMLTNRGVTTSVIVYMYKECVGSGFSFKHFNNLSGAVYVAFAVCTRVGVLYKTHH